jgi:hypothetical protein
VKSKATYARLFVYNVMTKYEKNWYKINANPNIIFSNLPKNTVNISCDSAHNFSSYVKGRKEDAYHFIVVISKVEQS